MRDFTCHRVLSFLYLFLALECSMFAQEPPRFPSFVPDHAPPADYTGMVFQLSQDYPTEAPPVEEMP